MKCEVDADSALDLSFCKAGALYNIARRLSYAAEGTLSRSKAGRPVGGDMSCTAACPPAPALVVEVEGAGVVWFFLIAASWPTLLLLLLVAAAAVGVLVAGGIAAFTAVGAAGDGRR